MDISSLLQHMTDVPLTLSREEFIRTLKKLEAEAYQLAKNRNTTPWRPGKGLELARELSRFKDTLIRKVADYSGGIPDGIALVAVGGYGREELSPYSDIDLLLLYQPRAPIAAFAGIFLYLLWDLQYHLGSSTRTVANALKQAKEDETFLTSLFAARFLGGNKALFYKLNAGLEKKLPSLRKTFLREKIRDIYSIFSNFNQEAPHKILLKEPNIKLSIGGLRSVHIMEWLNYACQRQAGLQGLRTCLDKGQFRRLYLAYDFLLYIRNLLHFLQARKEDYLYLDYHLEIARYLDLPGDDINKISCLLKHYHRRAMNILITQLYLAESFAQAFFKPERMKKMSFLTSRDQRYTVRDQRFFVSRDLQPSVAEAFDLLYICTANRYHASYSLLKYLQDAAALFDLENGDKTAAAARPNHFSSFVKILTLDNAYDALNTMKLAGFLYKVVPPFNLIKHLLIYNPFHKYTIDQHSLEAVGAIEKLFLQEMKETEKSKYALLKDLAHDYKQDCWIIKLSLLLHDTGKAYPGDHAKNSVEIAQSWLQTIPIPAAYKQLILFLIGNHLLLSHTIRRSDLSDTQTFTNLAREFQLTPFPLEYMDSLFLLTYADVYATNPKNYSSYFASRLNHTLKQVSALLFGKTDQPPQLQILEDTISRIAQLKHSTGRPARVKQQWDTESLAAFVRNLGEEYVLNNDESEIIQDMNNIQDFTGKGSGKDEKFRIEVKSYNDYFKVKFFAPDRLGLFSLLAGILALNGADIVRADIHTYNGVALDEFYILQIFNTELNEKSMHEQLKYWKADLEKLYKKYHQAYPLLAQHIKEFKPRVKKLLEVFHRPTEVKLEVTGKTDNPAGTSLLRLEIACTDRPALLFDICSCLANHNYEITGAIIDTTGWYVHDIFKLRTPCCPEQEKLEVLIAALKTAIEA